MNLLYRIYFLLPRGFLGYKFDVLMYKTLKLFFDNLYVPYLHFILNFHFNGLNKKDREKKIIVSLTSHPGRINSVWISLATILRQKVKPDKVILWLAKEQFPELKLPKSLIKLKKYGLTIRWCDEDLRSHKKYYYAFKEFQNDIIITFDDDVYYPNNVTKELYKLHKQNPDCICSNKVNKMLFADNRLSPYNKWIHNYKSNFVPSYELVQIGISGVLYPPNCFTKEVFQKEVFRKLCFYADDLWLKVCSLLNNKKVITSKYFNKELVPIKYTQRVGLFKINVFDDKNDSQLKNVLTHFDIDIYDFINQDK